MTDVITNQPGKVTFGEEVKREEEEKDTDKDEVKEEPFDRIFRPLNNIVLSQARGDKITSTASVSLHRNFRF
jgi:hypothetical protein